jgi:hypothetical protein
MKWWLDPPRRFRQFDRDLTLRGELKRAAERDPSWQPLCFV